MPGVVVVGSVHVDLVASAARLPRRGETLPGTGFAIHPGGKGGNQAVQVALNGIRSTMIGRVGRDPFGERLRAALQAKGVDTTYLTEDEEAPTGASTVLTGENGDYASVIVPGAAGRLERVDLERARTAFDRADVLLVQLEIDPQTVAMAVEMGKVAGLSVVLNAAPAPADAAQLPARLWDGVDVLIVNQVEAEMLSGQVTDDVGRSAAIAETLMLRYALSAVVITLGANGAVLVRRDGVLRCGAWPIPMIVDTIGAGDAFVGTLAASLASGATLDDAVLLGNAAGALAVTRAGAHDALPTAAAIHAFVGSSRD